MANSPQQIDLFLSEISSASLKDDMALMEFPFFSIQKTPRHTPIVFEDGDTEIRVEPSARGIATVWDKDILIYLATIINDRIDRNLPVDRKIRFSAYDCLKATGRGTGKRSYELFQNALYRLRSTTITTNIKSGNQRERAGFGWIETWRIIEQEMSNGRHVMKAVEVVINDWMYRALVHDRRVLTIKAEYFSLKGGLERRLYELARKHCGKQQHWEIGLSRLAEKCGTTRDRRKLKLDLNIIAENDSLPDYQLAIKVGKGSKHSASNCILVFTPRKRTIGNEFLEESIDHVHSSRMLEVSKQTIERATSYFSGYDVNTLLKIWQDWAVKKNMPYPDNPDAAFIAFCKKYVERNPLLVFI